MSCPLTDAHTSGDGCFCCLQPALPKRISALSGNSAAARTTCLERRSGKGDCKVRCSGSFLHAARANACRANPHMLSRAVHHTAHATQIRIPSPPPRIVCVADHVSKMRRLAAQFTLHRHNFPVQSAKNVKNVSHHSSRPLRVFPLKANKKRCHRPNPRLLAQHLPATRVDTPAALLNTPPR